MQLLLTKCRFSTQTQSDKWYETGCNRKLQIQSMQKQSISMNLFLGLLKCQTVFFFLLLPQFPFPTQLFLCFVLFLLCTANDSIVKQLKLQQQHRYRYNGLSFNGRIPCKFLFTMRCVACKHDMNGNLICPSLCHIQNCIETAEQTQQFYGMKATLTSLSPHCVMRVQKLQDNNVPFPKL